MPGEMPGDGTFSRSGGAINRYDDLSIGLKSAHRAIFQTHARFFVSCFVFGLGRAVKPYLLLLPALAPAVKAGLRLVRDGRASGRASWRGALPRVATAVRGLALVLPAVFDPFAWDPLVWPLRGLHAEAEDLAFRAGEAPFAGRAVPPAERRPFGLAPFDFAPLLDPLAA
jgi:hypothetical protein